jgi:cytidine deaminase
MTAREFQDLVAKAAAARASAHAPYSGYRVGAALLSTDGRIFTGVNVENSAYPTCICAETCALGSAVAAGATSFVAIAIVTEPPPGQLPGAPCGNCRQALSEFGLDLSVVLASVSGEAETMSLRDLLPRAFTAEDL